MASDKSTAPLRLDLVPSRGLIVALVGGHLLALTSLLVVDLGLTLKVALTVGIAGSLWVHWLRYGAVSSHWFVERLACSVAGEWTLGTADGRVRTVQLRGSYVHPQLVILNFRGDHRWWQSCSLVIPADATDADSLRRLRVRLRTGGMEEET
jgi:hypothetical protein